MRDLQIFSISCSAGRVAQSVEQRIENPRVDSSILSPATSIYKDLQLNCVSPFILGLTLGLTDEVMCPALSLSNPA